MTQRDHGHVAGFPITGSVPVAGEYWPDST
jgi:hypothetical protein